MNRDIFTACMFEQNHTLMLSLLNQSRRRMADLCGGGEQATAVITQLFEIAAQSCHHCQVVFLAVLNMDTELKRLLLEGIARYKLTGVSEGKAALFYEYLETQIMLPWLINEHVTHTELISKAKELYILA